MSIKAAKLRTTRYVDKLGVMFIAWIKINLVFRSAPGGKIDKYSKACSVRGNIIFN